MKIFSLEDVKKWLSLALEILTKIKGNDNSLESIKDIFIEEIAKAWMKNGQVLWPLRCTLSWEEFSPWAIELVYIFWVEESIKRLSRVAK
jgi:predicted Zn-dependent peptidase